MPRRGAATVFAGIAASAFVVASARVVASFARNLVSTDTADTTHRRLLSLILADSAHTVGRVDDDAQLHLSCHGAWSGLPRCDRGSDRGVAAIRRPRPVTRSARTVIGPFLWGAGAGRLVLK